MKEPATLNYFACIKKGTMKADQWYRARAGSRPISFTFTKSNLLYSIDDRFRYRKVIKIVRVLKDLDDGIFRFVGMEQGGRTDIYQFDNVESL